ncbi:MAG: branched-chain amino acid ABC transporter permease [bacterium]|nr:branched-chain amino acid ABC transporter permease [bacterium]
MQTTSAILIDGLVYASWIFLVSVGLTLIFGVLRILNLAHGSLYAIGAYMGAWLVVRFFQPGMPLWLSIVLLLFGALLVGAVMGPLVERLLLRRTYGRDEVLQLLVTYALFLILGDLTKLIWGVNPYYAYLPYSLMGNVTIGKIPYPRYDGVLIVAAIVVGLGLWAIVNRTRFGKFMVAVIRDREISTTLGINVPLVCTAAFTIGTTLAAIGGALTAPTISVVPGIDVTVIVLSFAVVVIGGLGSLEGAALGSIIVGLARASAVHLFPDLDLVAIYLVMAVVLIFKPQGLFGRVEAKRI